MAKNEKKKINIYNLHIDKTIEGCCEGFPPELIRINERWIVQCFGCRRAGEKSFSLSSAIEDWNEVMKEGK